MKYALFPVETRDDRTYATITMDFGTEKSLFDKGTVDLTSYYYCVALTNIVCKILQINRLMQAVQLMQVLTAMV